MCQTRFYSYKNLRYLNSVHTINLANFLKLYTNLWCVKINALILKMNEVFGALDLNRQQEIEGREDFVFQYIEKIYNK